MDLTTVCPVALFDNFVTASTCPTILEAFDQMCLALNINKNGRPLQTYENLKKATASNWKATKLWNLLDSRRTQKEYFGGRACTGARTLVIGGGPCGLRSAIECALLGSERVVLVEARHTFSRNNVLHLWPFVIDDVKALGGKIFYPRFCAGAIDHISIRQLQCTLLKTALCLGVSVHTGVGFAELVLPCTHPVTEESIGWRAEFTNGENVATDHYLSNYEFDAVIAADGKQNSLPGFERREMRGKLAIGVTVNFVNARTQQEERVEEISGVASIFNQQFFSEMITETGIDLENIVYYKDDTHYFVMCAKKQSLLEKGVLKTDLDDVKLLLHSDNVDQAMLQQFAREAADFATNGRLPRLDFALNNRGNPDVAMFDFTSLYSAQHSSRIADRAGRRLLMTIVGDSLHEPFWPTGSGCARGFLGVFDACWMLRGFCRGKQPVLDLLAERESMFRLLPQSTVNTLQAKISAYTIDPSTRYKSADFNAVRPDQVRHLIETDNTDDIWNWLQPAKDTSIARYATRPPTQFDTLFDRQHSLLTYLTALLREHRLPLHNLNDCWVDGLALCALVASNDLLDYGSLDKADVKGNRRLAFNLIERQFGLTTPSDDGDWLDGEDTTNEQIMFDYLMELAALIELQLVEKRHVLLTSSMAAKTAKSGRFQKKKRAATLVISSADLEKAELADRLKSRSRGDDDAAIQEMTARLTDEQVESILQDLSREDQRESSRSFKDDGPSHHIGKLAWRADGTRVLDDRPHAPIGSTNNGKVTKRPGFIQKLDVLKVDAVEQMISGQLCREQSDEFHARKRREAEAKTGKLDDKGVQEMTKKLEQTAVGPLPQEEKEKWRALSSGESAVMKGRASNAREKVNQGFQRAVTGEAAAFDHTMEHLTRRARASDSYKVTPVSFIAKQHDTPMPTLPRRATNVVQPVVRVPDVTPAQPACYICAKRVYLAEKMTVEGVVLHKRCYRCAYCNTALRVGTGLDRSLGDSFGAHFFCRAHQYLPMHDKAHKLTKRVVADTSPSTVGDVGRPSYNTSDATSDGTSHDEESSDNDQVAHDADEAQDAQLRWAAKRERKLAQQRQHLPWVRASASTSSNSDDDHNGEHEATPIPAPATAVEEVPLPVRIPVLPIPPVPTTAPPAFAKPSSSGGMLSQLFGAPSSSMKNKVKATVASIPSGIPTAETYRAQLGRLRDQFNDPNLQMSDSARASITREMSLLTLRLQSLELEATHTSLQKEYTACITNDADLHTQQAVLQKMLKLIEQRDAIKNDIQNTQLKCELQF